MGGGNTLPTILRCNHNADVGQHRLWSSKKAYQSNRDSMTVIAVIALKTNPEATPNNTAG